jgi:hypothetical protein
VELRPLLVIEARVEPVVELGPFSRGERRVV